MALKMQRTQRGGSDRGRDNRERRDRVDETLIATALDGLVALVENVDGGWSAVFENVSDLLASAPQVKTVDKLSEAIEEGDEESVGACVRVIRDARDDSHRVVITWGLHEDQLDEVLNLVTYTQMQSERWVRIKAFGIREAAAIAGSDGPIYEKAFAADVVGDMSASDRQKLVRRVNALVGWQETNETPKDTPKGSALAVLGLIRASHASSVRSPGQQFIDWAIGREPDPELGKLEPEKKGGGIKLGGKSAPAPAPSGKLKLGGKDKDRGSDAGKDGDKASALKGDAAKIAEGLRAFIWNESTKKGDKKTAEGLLKNLGSGQDPKAIREMATDWGFLSKD